MTPFNFARRSLTRQPARALLGIAGIAVVGALLFDMLLLSRGLVESLKQLMDQGGYDVRITQTASLPGSGPRVKNLATTLERLRNLPGVSDVAALRFGSAEVSTAGEHPAGIVAMMGANGPARDTWTIVTGENLPERAGDGPRRVLVNRVLAESMKLEPGSALQLRGDCGRANALPLVDFRVTGIVEQRFESTRPSMVVHLTDFATVCSDQDPDAADLLLVASSAGEPDGLVESIHGLLPDIHAYSNQQFVDRLQAREFSYYRQISFVLTTVTLFFAFLLIATMLTVSVNQRLGEVAALRALGFPRRRVVADLLWESALLVGIGGLLGFPLGELLSRWLDGILRSIPGVPERIEFFFYQPRIAVIYTILLAATGVLAAFYPIYLAARLPIAATLRREVVS